jgi:hypothetical protein
MGANGRSMTRASPPSRHSTAPRGPSTTRGASCTPPASSRSRWRGAGAAAPRRPRRGRAGRLATPLADPVVRGPVGERRLAPRSGQDVRSRQRQRCRHGRPAGHRPADGGHRTRAPPASTGARPASALPPAIGAFAIALAGAVGLRRPAAWAARVRRHPLATAVAAEVARRPAVRQAVARGPSRTVISVEA